jgi:DNA-binding NarL/FixJ family response regulator
MPRRKTEEDRARWAEYMRTYRRENPDASKERDELPPTERQIEILRTYADPSRGGTYARVADSLGISPSAVHNQMGRLLRRLGVKTPAQAVYKLWVEANGKASTDEVPGSSE